jgi:OOP family OmpA-OmpF porin
MAGFGCPTFRSMQALVREKNISAIFRRSTINFVTGSARLGAKSSRVINNLAATLRNCLASGALRVEVGGHTDSQGDDTANMELSKERAEAVQQALLLRGVPGKGLQASGFGETQPIADNNTEEGRAANRRTTFIWFEN